MIQSFRNTATETFCRTRVPPRFLPPDIRRRAFARLLALDSAETLQDLRSPPGNHLEALAGDRSGQHSVRINRQWRVCFTWGEDGPEQVEIVDYHVG